MHGVGQDQQGTGLELALAVPCKALGEEGRLWGRSFLGYLKSKTLFQGIAWTQTPLLF